jgi:putrescine transport system substrate-binding protein
MNDTETHVTELTEPLLVRHLRSMPLAAVLSTALVLVWIAYLVIVPVPTPPPPAEPAVAEEKSDTAVTESLDSSTIRILLWRDVLGPDVFSVFEAESGLNISVENYNTFEDLAVIMESGWLNYDLVIASGMDVPSMIKRGLLHPLSSELVPRAETLDPAVLKRAEVYDSGNSHSLPLMWGTVGLAFDRAKIAERLGASTEVDSWSLLFDPSKVKAFASCGVQVVDAPGGVFSIALTYLNRSHDSGTVEDTDAAVRLWEGVRPSIAKFSTTDVVDNLARGDVCFAMVASGDAYKAAAQSRALGVARDVHYVIPMEGTVLWHVVSAIPIKAAYPDHALKLIDYLMRPEVAARITNATGFISAVRDAAFYIKPEIKNNLALNPQIDSLDNVVPEMATSAEEILMRRKFWQLINTPQQQESAPN